MPPLDTLFAHLLRRARATGKLQTAKLHGGARVAVKVLDGRVSVSIGRSGAPVGASEEQTFRRFFKVPAHAQRRPVAGQAHKPLDDQDWNVIGWIWDDIAERGTL
jgi:hypothetical protein